MAETNCGSIGWNDGVGGGRSDGKSRSAPYYLRFFFAMNFIFIGVAHADVFKCVTDGKVSYSSTPCVAGAVPYQGGRAPASPPSGTGGSTPQNGSINGRPGKFLVDASLPYTTISSAFAYKLGLLGCGPVPKELKHRFGPDDVCVMTIGSLKYANLDISHMDVNVNLKQAVDVIIGSDLSNKLDNSMPAQRH